MTIESKTYGYYLYCVIESSKFEHFGNIGIEGKEVLSIPHENISCIAHIGEAKPYNSQDINQVKKLLESHNNVIETIWKKFKTVVPFRFNTIIKITNEEYKEENVINWLKENQKDLEEKLARFKGKAEYGIQVFCDPNIIGKKILEKDNELVKLKQDIDKMSEGLAYMKRQKLEQLLKLKLEEELNKKFIEFYAIIKPCIIDSKIEKIKKEDDEKMLLNMSCLVEDVSLLGEELDKIDKQAGFRVRFVGPFPPYSFA
jgi:hypothetical protein